MIIIEGKTYSTIVDASKTLGVSAKTVRGYIEKGIIPAPPIIRYGIRAVMHFPTEYMKKAKQLLDRYKTGSHG
jgi:hypothetical protein